MTPDKLKAAQTLKLTADAELDSAESLIAKLEALQSAGKTDEASALAKSIRDLFASAENHLFGVGDLLANRDRLKV